MLADSVNLLDTLIYDFSISKKGSFYFSVRINHMDYDLLDIIVANIYALITDLAVVVLLRSYGWYIYSPYSIGRIST